MAVRTSSPHPANASTINQKALETTRLVGLLRWTYQRQKADSISGRALWGPESKAEPQSLRIRKHWSGCGCAQIEAIAALGVRIANGGQQRETLHPDAESVHDLVVEISRTDWAGAMLLRRYGKQGGTPDWESGTQEFEPLRDGRDKIVQDRYDEIVHITDKAGRKRIAPVLYCPLVKYPSDDWIDLMRGEYTAWFNALEKLGQCLEQTNLIRWQVTGLGAPSSPWITNNENKS